MARLSIRILALFVIIMCQPVVRAEEGRKAPERSILLFGASWCAPCIGELRDISRIAEAAAPDHVVILWQDGGISRFKVPVHDNLTMASDIMAQQLSDRYGRELKGLPYSVMIDERGRECAKRNRPLTPEAVKELQAACNAKASGH